MAIRPQMGSVKYRSKRIDLKYSCPKTGLMASCDPITKYRASLIHYAVVGNIDKLSKKCCTFSRFVTILKAKELKR